MNDKERIEFQAEEWLLSLVDKSVDLHPHLFTSRSHFLRSALIRLLLSLYKVETIRDLQHTYRYECLGKGGNEID